jgi:hypothetical protein
MILYSTSAFACFWLASSPTPTRLFNLLGSFLLLTAGIHIKQLLYPIPTNIDQLKQFYNVDTEVGRELGGLTIVAGWMMLMLILEDVLWKRKQSVGSGGVISWGLVGAALGVLAMVWVGPKYLMSGPAAEDHCRGVGFDAKKD